MTKKIGFSPGIIKISWAAVQSRCERSSKVAAQKQSTLLNRWKLCRIHNDNAPVARWLTLQPTDVFFKQTPLLFVPTERRSRPCFHTRGPRPRRDTAHAGHRCNTTTFFSLCAYVINVAMPTTAPRWQQEPRHSQNCRNVSCIQRKATPALSDVTAF